MAREAQLSVPPGFRFHPTDEELLYYYLRKKVSYEAIDLDVIREVDLNKLEPWDLKDKCKIGSGPQNEWYFFSHKDKKYPTGTRTNRATTAGFWKATGRDKAIHLSDSTRIGMRKTLVFYTGRAPHGQKTDWIMHEYRLDDDINSDVQEDGWVVCRVFKKKNQSRGLLPDVLSHHEDHDELHNFSHIKATAAGTTFALDDPKHNQMIVAHPQHQHLALSTSYDHYTSHQVDASMHLPQLLSPETGGHHHHPPHPPTSFFSPPSNNIISTCTDMGCSQNLLMKLTASAGGGLPQAPDRFATGDWLFLDKLLASHPHNLNPHSQSKTHSLVSSLQVADMSTPGTQKFSFSSYLASENESLKFSK